MSIVDVATGPDFTVRKVICRDDHTGWSAVDRSAEYRVVLVRRGRFHRAADGVPAEVDPTMAYIGVPGEDEQFAHPAGGDVCTRVGLAPDLWRELAGDAKRLSRSAVHVDGSLDLAHRRVPAAAGTSDVAYAVVDQLMALLGQIAEQAVSGPAPVRARPSTADRALVIAAREAIGAAHPAAGGLITLADLLEVSPLRLSRAFSRELGMSLTRYRNRIRLGRALDRLEQGESSLARLAADLGFADQAHLSRSLSQHVDHSPAALRRLLGPISG